MVFGFGLKWSVTLLQPNPTTFPLPNNFVPTCASMAPVQLLAVRKNTQLRLICLPRRHFISHYQQRKLRAFPQAPRRLFTETTPASLNGALHALTQSLQNPGKSVQKLLLGLSSCGSGPQSCACSGYRALPCSQNGIRLRREIADSNGFGTTVIHGFEHYWENRLDDRIKTGQPSTNEHTQVTDCALGKCLKQIKFSSSILAWLCCIFQCKILSPCDEHVHWLLQAIHLLTWLRCPRSRVTCRASWRTISLLPWLETQLCFQHHR